MGRCFIRQAPSLNVLNGSSTITNATVNYVEGITNYLLYDPSTNDLPPQTVYGIDSEVALGDQRAEHHRRPDRRIFLREP